MDTKKCSVKHIQMQCEVQGVRYHVINDLKCSNKLTKFYSSVADRLNDISNNSQGKIKSVERHSTLTLSFDAVFG